MKLVKSFAAAAVVLTGTITQAAVGDKTQYGDYYTIEVDKFGTTAYVFTNAAERATSSLKLPKNLMLFRALLVGGGGGGGSGVGGGGGAGGMLELTPNENLAAGTTISFKVGAGGAGGKGYDAQGGKDYAYTTGGTGECTTVTFGGTTYTAFGGGGGGCQYARINGKDGGSGGGGAGDSNNPVFPSKGGKGTAGQGCDGGDSGASNMYAAGGGGAGNAGKSGRTEGANNVRTYGGDGGDGKISDITGEEVWYAGGGGGSACAWDRLKDPRANKPGSGGKGGGGTASGGNGSNLPKGYEEYCDTLNRVATPGTDGLGGGGGAGVRYNSADNWEYLDGAKGGSGTVILLLGETRTVSNVSVSKDQLTVTLGEPRANYEYLYLGYGKEKPAERNEVSAWEKVRAVADISGLQADTYSFACTKEKEYGYCQVFVRSENNEDAFFRANEIKPTIYDSAILDGTQFFKTEHRFASDEDLEIKLRFTAFKESSSSPERIVFWSRVGSGAGGNQCSRVLFNTLYNASKVFRYDYGAGSGTSTAPNPPFSTDADYVLTTKGRTGFTYVDVADPATTNTFSTSFNTATFKGAPLYLFGHAEYTKTDGVLTDEDVAGPAPIMQIKQRFDGWFYYAKIFNTENEIVAYYVPAKDPSDNKVKLFDQVSGKFIPAKKIPTIAQTGSNVVEPMGPEAETTFEVSGERIFSAAAATSVISESNFIFLIK